MKTLRTLGFLGTGWCLCLLTTTAFGQYSVTRIPSLGGSAMDVRALNSAGSVVGFSRTAGDAEQHGFRYQGGSLTDIPTLGGLFALADALNSQGHVAGDSGTADGGYHAFLFTGGTPRDLGTLGGVTSFGMAINDAGDVAGQSETIDGSTRVYLFRNGATEMLDAGSLGGGISFFGGMNTNSEITGYSLTSDGSTHAFLYRNGSMGDLGTLPGGSSSVGAALNDFGHVVGQADAANGEMHAFVVTNGVMTSLGTLGGTWSTAYKINNAGDVLGDSFTADDAEYHAFIVTNGVRTDLGVIAGGFSSGYDMNNRRQVVGDSFDEIGFTVPFLWENGVMVDLNTLLPADSGWDLITARFINDAGQIVGQGTFEGVSAWYMLSRPNSGNQAPTANAGLDQTVECGSAVQLSGSGVDPDGDVLTYEWRNGSTVLGNTAALSVNLGLGNHTLTLRVTDPAGLSNEDTVLITVEDTTAPVVACPGAQTVPVGPNCSATVPDLTGSVLVTDDCSGSFTKSQSPAAGTSVGVGTHTVTVTVADASGNSGSCTVALHVVDRTAPTGHCSDPVTVSANANGTAAVVDFLASLNVTDNCTPASALVKTQSPAAGTQLGLGSHVVTLTVTDAAGNQSSCTTLFHVVDRSAPVLTTPALVDVSAGANGLGTVPNLLPLCSVTDNCDSDVALVQSPAAGTQLPLGEHTITITATDDSGNSVSGTTTLRVKDTTPPVITSVTVNPNSIDGRSENLVAVNVTVNATDNTGSVTSKIVSITSSDPVVAKGDKTSPDWVIDGNLNGRVRAEVGSGSKVRVYTITVQSTDAFGNTATATTTVTAQR